MSKETDIFVQKHASDVITSVKGTTLFPSLKMAQMIIESSGKDAQGKFGIGKGLAVRKANNYFGIKADKNWKGKKVTLSTPKDGKKVSSFRVYNTVLESLKDHTRFLLENARYKTHGVFVAKTPQQQAEALQKAGYSESPTYSKALIGLIKAYNLENLDKPRASAATTDTPYIAIGAIALFLAGVVYYRKEVAAHLKQITQN